MFGLFKKYSVSILNRQWVEIKPIIKIKHMPRSGELIYFEDTDEYYRVISIVHYINNKHGIFLIVDKLEEKPTN